MLFALTAFPKLSMFRRVVSLAAVIAISIQVSLAAAQVRPSGLIDTREIPKYGLHRAWFTQLPIDSSVDSLEKIFVYDSEVYAQTESGMLIALDGESGELLWSTQIGVPYRSHSEPTFSDEYIVFIGGSTLYVLNRDDGALVWSRPRSSTQGLGATIVAGHAFVSDSDSLMHAYSMAEEDRGSSGLYFTSLGKPVTAPVAGVKTVSWTNDRGDLLIADSLQEGTSIQVQLTSTVIAPLDNQRGIIYAASLGGFLYAIEEESGRIQWRFSAGEAIRKSVYVGSDVVFVVTELGEMSCVDRETGIARWRITGVGHFVAQSPTHIYVKDHFGRLLMLDATTGNILTTIRMEPLKHLAANTVNDRIYLGTDRGLVQSLRESDLKKPVPLIEQVMEENTAEVKTDAIEM